MSTTAPLHLSPFLPGCFVQLEADDPHLAPSVRHLVVQALALYVEIQRCGLAERRARLAHAPADGVTLGPLAAPYFPAFDVLAMTSEALVAVSEQIARGALPGVSPDLFAYNQRVAGEVMRQVACMNAALLAHCVDATDADAGFAARSLDRLAHLVSA